MSEVDATCKNQRRSNPMEKEGISVDEMQRAEIEVVQHANEEG